MILNLEHWSLTVYYSKELLSYHQPSVRRSEYYLIPAVALMAVRIRRRFFFNHFSLDQLFF